MVGSQTYAEIWQDRHLVVILPKKGQNSAQRLRAWLAGGGSPPQLSQLSFAHRSSSPGSITISPNCAPTAAKAAAGVLSLIPKR